MRILIVGAAGVLGRATLPHLGGHAVMGTTRATAKLDLLASLGAQPACVDVYDAGALEPIACAFAARRRRQLPHGSGRWPGARQRSYPRRGGTHRQRRGPGQRCAAAGRREHRLRDGDRLRGSRRGTRERRGSLRSVAGDPSFREILGARNVGRAGTYTSRDLHRGRWRPRGRADPPRRARGPPCRRLVRPLGAAFGAGRAHLRCWAPVAPEPTWR